MTADKIELYLKPSGDELDRVEAYDERHAARAETAKRPAAASPTRARDEQYLVIGTPVKVIDACGRETIGQDVDLLQGDR